MAKTLLAAYGFRVLDRILMLETVRPQTAWYIVASPRIRGWAASNGIRRASH